jgi:hypothetical protein
MRSCHNHIRILFLMIVLLGTSIVTNHRAEGQDDNFEMKVHITNATSVSSQDGALQIEIDRYDNQYDYMLYDKEPWSGGKLISEQKTDELQATFTALKAGTYYVCVRNSTEVTRCLNITIKSNL